MCKAIEQATAGDGFRRTHNLHLLSNVREVNGGPCLPTNWNGLTMTATNPAPAALESNFIGLVAASSTTFMGKFSWTIPADYDDTKDEWRIRVACNMAGNTNSGVTITPTVYRKRPIPSIIPAELTNFPAGLALSGDLGIPAAVDTIPLLGSNLLTKWVDINADYWTDFTKRVVKRTGTGDVSLKPGDCVQVTLTSSAHTTDAINIYGISLWYRSNLAFTDKNSR
jgi:hypothetical protein